MPRPSNALIVFWTWFPVGIAGIRTLLLCIPAFLIFILRVGQLHVGTRTSFSGWQTFRGYSFRSDFLQTIGFYVFSAYVFSEIYIWSASEDADLNKVKLIPKTKRPMLNEKPIYLTSYLIILAIAQAGFHLYYDYDKIDMPVAKTKTEASSDQASHLIVPPEVQLRTKFVSLLSMSALRAFGVAVASPFIYSLSYPYSVRQIAWGLNRFWAKIFWNLPKSGSLPSTQPYRIDVLIKTVWSGFLLLMLWELGNAAFSAYVAQEPLKNDRPITFESRDPNGSLLTGLKGKKLQTRVGFKARYYEHTLTFLRPSLSGNSYT